MRAVVQRVQSGRVSLKENQENKENQIIGQIGRGYVILLGVGQEDEQADSVYLADKVANLRIFPDSDDKLNLSILEVGGEVLVVSQFTLFGDCRKGRRPSFFTAADPKIADELYEHFVGELVARGLKVATGVFQTDMLVEIANDGPVTILLDSKKVF